VRYFRPLSAREIVIRVGSRDGQILSVQRHLAETDSLPTLGEEEARGLALDLLRRQGIDPAAFDLKDAAELKRPHRLDRTFTWEAKAEDPRNVGEAHHRIEVVVQGNQIGSYRPSLKIPEEWLRQRDKGTLWATLRRLELVLAAGALLGLLLWTVLSEHKAGRIQWRRILLMCIPLAGIALAGVINAWPLAMSRYSNVVPWGIFLGTILVGVALGSVVNYLLAAASLATATSQWPASWGLRHPVARRSQLADAFLATAAGLVLLAALDHLGAALFHMVPALASVPTVSKPLGASAFQCWFGIVFNVLRPAVAGIGLGAGILGLLRLSRRFRLYTILLAGLIALALVPSQAVTGPEFLLGLLWSIVQVAVLLAIARALLAGNLLAWPLLLYVVLSVRATVPWIGADGAFYRTQGMIAAAFLALPLVWLLFSALRAGEEPVRRGVR
jgi:hypothetical protein